MNSNSQLPLSEACNDCAMFQSLTAELTAAKKREFELQQLLKRLKLALTTLHCIIYDWEIAQQSVNRTEGLFEVLGYHPLEAQPTLEWWTARIHPDDRDRVKQEVANALATCYEFAVEYRVCHHNGEYLEVCDKGLILRNLQGQAVRVVGSTLDMTESKRIQRAIAQQQQFLRNIIDINPNLIFAKDWEGRFTLANQALADAYGTTIETLMGKTDADFNSNSAEVEQFIQADREVMRSLQPKFILEEQCTYANGDVHWLQTIKKPLLLSDRPPQVLAVATDITERKQAQIELQHANAVLESRVAERTAAMSDLNRQLIFAMTERQQVDVALQQQLAAVEAATDGIAILNNQGQYIYLNNAHVKLFGYDSAQEFIGKTWELLYDRSEIAQFQSQYLPELWLKGSWRGEVTARKRDRTQFPIEVSLTAIEDRGMICVCRDISDRRLAEAKLKASQERFRTLVETLSDWVWEVNENYIFTYVSPKVRDILGYDSLEVQGKTFFELMLPEEAFRMANDLGSTTAKTLPFACFEATHLHKNGNPIILEISGVPIINEAGEFRGYRGVSRDITERKQVEEALKISEERFRVIFEREAIGVSLTNLEGRLLASNPKLQEMMGYDEAELAGMNFTEFTHPEDIATDLNHFQELVSGKLDSYQMEKRYIRKDGRVVWGYLTVSLIRKTGKLPQLATATIHDITHRKQMEETLKESEERFRQLAEHINEVFWVYSLEPYQMLYVSPAYEKIWGRSLQSLYEQNHSWLEAIHPEDREQISTALETESQGNYDYEYRIIRPDGTLRWIRDRAFSVCDAQGKVYRLVGIAEDITERQESEKALRESEERFRKIFEDSPIGIAVTSPQTQRLLRSNQALCKMLGYSERELSHFTFAEITHPDDLEESMRCFESLHSEGSSSYNLEKRYLKKDGEILWANETFAVLRKTNGEMIFGLATLEDITQRKRAEEESNFLQLMAKAVYESEDFQSALLMTIQKVCEATHWDFGEAWIPCIDGNFLECSPAWYSRSDSLLEFRTASESLRFAPGEGIPGRVWITQKPEWRRDVSSESSEVYLRAKLAQKAGLKAALGLPILAVDGVLAVLVFYMFQSRDEDARLIEVISASTELGLLIQRKRAEEEIRKALVKEKELNELKSRFVSMTSHEFRTPLGTILSSAELLEKYRIRWTEEKQTTHLQRIQTAVKHMTEMLNNVLTLGKAEAGKLEFNPTFIDLERFCRDLVDGFQLEEENQQRIIFHSDSFGDRAFVDEKLLRHILTNLLCNALKYSSQESSVELSLKYEENQAVFQVRDWGIGIPSSDQKRLFESFHRASNVGNIQGTGLGLAIVKNCVDLQGGRISISSQVGVGTTFTVSLPI